MTARANNCLQFDGVDDYVSVNRKLPPTDMTHELWFKTTLPDGSLWCVTNPDHTETDRHMYLRGGNLYVCFWEDTPIGSSGLNLADGHWHHVAHVYGLAAGGQQLYIDGQLVAQCGTTASKFPNPTELLIGYCPDASPPYFAGRISEIRLWHTIVAAEQLHDYLALRLWGNEAGLLGYWPLKGGKPVASEAGEPQPKKRGKKALVTAIDKTHQQNGRIHGAERTFDADLHLAPPPSLTNPALIFDGTDDYLAFPNPFEAHETFTLELWMKPEHIAPGGEYGILGYVDNASGRCKPSLWLVAPTNDNAPAALRYDSYDAAGQRYSGLIETWFDPPAAWVHLAWVSDGSAYQFYRNGKLFHTAEHAPARLFAPADTPYLVGQVDSFWSGQLAEVRVWQTARTAKEIRQQMKYRLRGSEAGLVACWPLNDGSDTVTDVTDGSHNGRVYGAHLGSTDLQFRAPRTSPPGAEIAASTYSAQPDSIYDLLAETNDFRALYQRLHDATEHPEEGPATVTLNSAVLGAFTLFHTLEKLRLDSLTITDPRLEFISESDDVDWSSPTAEDVMGLRLRGTTTLLGLSNAHVTLECSLDDEHQQASVLKIQSHGEMHMPVRELLGPDIQIPDQLAHLLDYVGHLHMAAPVLAVGNQSFEGETDFPFNLGIHEGLNIYGVLDLTGLSDSNPFALIRHWLNIDALELHTTLCHHTTGWQVMQETVVEKDTPVLSGAGLELVYKGADITIEIVGQPPEMAIMLSNTLLLSLNWFATDELYLTGTMKLETESFTGAYTLQQSPGSDKAWSPFGLSGISVQALAMQLGGTYLAPWIDNVGIATDEVTIGDIQASLAVLVDTNDPDQFVFHLAINQTTLLQLLAALTPITFAAYQSLPRLWRQTMETIVNIDMEDVVIHVVPAPTRIGSLEFEDEGILVRGKLSSWGWDANVNVAIDWDDIDLAIDVEPASLRLGRFVLLGLEGYEDNTHPRLAFTRGDEVDTAWYLGLELVLLGTRHQLFSQNDQAHIVFNITNYFPFLKTMLDVDRQDGTTTANAQINLVLNLNMPGHSRVQHSSDLFGLVFKAALHYTGTAEDLAAELQGDLLVSWGGHETRLSIAPRFATHIPDIDGIKDTVRTYAITPVKNMASRVKGKAADLVSRPAAPADSDQPADEAPRTVPPADQPANGQGVGLVGRVRQGYQQTSRKLSSTVQQMGGKLRSAVGNGTQQKPVPAWVAHADNGASPQT